MVLIQCNYCYTWLAQLHVWQIKIKCQKEVFVTSYWYLGVSSNQFNPQNGISTNVLVIAKMSEKMFSTSK